MQHNDKLVLEYDLDEKDGEAMNFSSSGYSSSVVSAEDNKKKIIKSDTIREGEHFDHPEGSIYSKEGAPN